MTLPLAYYGQDVLREKAEPVTLFDADLRTFSQQMISTMHAESGIGLAGPQVFHSKRIFVMEIPSEMDEDLEGRRLNPQLQGPLVAVNPEIHEASEEQDVLEEGCLSIPEVRGNVERPVAITLAYQDVEGTACEMRLQGLAARCAQHELDHLNGVLFIDYLSPVKKVAIKGKLKRLRASHGG
jgi:peptide deformylase